MLQQDETVVTLDQMREDFILFVRAVWADRGLDQVAPLSEVEIDILEYGSRGPFNPKALAEAAAGGGKIETRRGILAFRSIGKTHLITASYTLWLLFRDPGHKILLTSKTEQEAKKTLRLIRGWINEISFLRYLAPRDGQEDAALQFTVGPCGTDRNPSVSARGIGGQLPGLRAHTVIGDDLETPENTKTVDARDELDRRVREFASILFPTGEIIFIGTYHHVESLYIRLSNRGYAFRSWPITLPHPHEEVLNLAPILQKRLETGKSRPDDLTCPHRFPHEYVALKQAEGRTYFDMQFRLISGLGAQNLYPLKLSDLIIYDMAIDRAPVSLTYGTQNHNGSTADTTIPCLGFTADRLYRPIYVDPDLVPYLGTKAFIDPAGRGKDETAMAIGSSLGGLIWCHDVIGISGGITPDNLNAMAQAARKYRVTEILYEENIDVFGTFRQMLDVALKQHFIEPGRDPDYPNGWKCSLQGSRAAGNTHKEARVCDTLEPVMSTHRLIIHPRALRPSAKEPDYELQRQIAFMTRASGALRHDDRVDALTGLVRAWKDSMYSDPAKAAERHRKRSMTQDTKVYRW